MTKQPRVHQSVDLSDGSGRLVVCDWSAKNEPYNHNLTRLDAAGNPVWRAELPPYTSPNCYVGVGVDGDTIHANTWSCHRVTLDPATGKILTIVFTK